MKDAIKITRRLGIKYPWIDCLCIIQDGPAGWEVEAANMAYIYQNAYVTIEAAASADSYCGCVPKRNTDSYVSPGIRSLGYDRPREASGPDVFTMVYENTASRGKRSALHFFQDQASTPRGDVKSALSASVSIPSPPSRGLARLDASRTLAITACDPLCHGPAVL